MNELKSDARSVGIFYRPMLQVLDRGSSVEYNFGDISVVDNPDPLTIEEYLPNLKRKEYDRVIKVRDNIIAGITRDEYGETIHTNKEEDFDKFLALYQLGLSHFLPSISDLRNAEIHKGRKDIPIDPFTYISSSAKKIGRERLNREYSGRAIDVNHLMERIDEYKEKNPEGAAYLLRQKFVIDTGRGLYEVPLSDLWQNYTTKEEMDRMKQTLYNHIKQHPELGMRVIKKDGEKKIQKYDPSATADEVADRLADTLISLEEKTGLNYADIRTDEITYGALYDEMKTAPEEKESNKLKAYIKKGLALGASGIFLATAGAAFAPLVSADSGDTIYIVHNEADGPAADELADYLDDYTNVEHASPDNWLSVAHKPGIKVILGGPDAYDGIGEIVES
ncbi:MAG: hypothetical protein J7J92_02455, partial [Candidatus Aenigmarchaeota archaeon]|nr:hypothetical protein [Candidatus Aenigmarchaeota archaeon]